ARRPAMRIFSCSSGVLMVTCMVGGARLLGRARKTLFRREVHGIKRRLFWQRNPTRASRTRRLGVLEAAPPARGCCGPRGWSPGMRGGLTQAGVFYARRVHATDAGGGCPLRTSDPLLEPEDGSLHLRRT